jgi:hypothetical protein
MVSIHFRRLRSNRKHDSSESKSPRIAWIFARRAVMIRFPVYHELLEHKLGIAETDLGLLEVGRVGIHCGCGAEPLDHSAARPREVTCCLVSLDLTNADALPDELDVLGKHTGFVLTKRDLLGLEAVRRLFDPGLCLDVAELLHRDRLAERT